MEMFAGWQFGQEDKDHSQVDPVSELLDKKLGAFAQTAEKPPNEGGDGAPGREWVGAEIDPNSVDHQEAEHDGEDKAQHQHALIFMAALVAFGIDHGALVQAIQDSQYDKYSKEILNQCQGTKPPDPGQHKVGVGKGDQTLHDRCQDGQGEQHKTPKDEEMGSPWPAKSKEPQLATNINDQPSETLPQALKRSTRLSAAQVDQQELVAASSKDPQRCGKAKQNKD